MNERLGEQSCWGKDWRYKPFDGNNPKENLKHKNCIQIPPDNIESNHILPLPSIFLSKNTMVEIKHKNHGPSANITLLTSESCKRYRWYYSIRMKVRKHKKESSQPKKDATFFQNDSIRSNLPNNRWNKATSEWNEIFITTR